MDKMTQAQKFAAVRNQAKEQFLNLPTNAYQVGVDTYAVETQHGWAKVTVQAVKDANFDAEQAAIDYRFEVEQKLVEKQAKDMEKRIKADLRAAEKAKNKKTKTE